MSREAKRSLEKTIKKADLADAINKLTEQVNQINNNIIVLDAGVFLAIHSLTKEDRIYFPKLNETSDIEGTGVIGKISEMRRILEGIQDNERAKSSQDQDS